MWTKVRIQCVVCLIALTVVYFALFYLYGAKNALYGVVNTTMALASKVINGTECALG